MPMYVSVYTHECVCMYVCVCAILSPVTRVKEGDYQFLWGWLAAARLQMGEELLAAMPRTAKDLQRSERMIFVCQIVFLT